MEKKSIPLHKIVNSQEKTARGKERAKETTKQPEDNKQYGNNKSLPINNYLNMNRLNSPTKRNEVAEWIK